MQTAIERIESHRELIANGEHDRVSPGMPHRISEAACVGDGVWQGDLGVEVLNKVWSGWKLVRNPTDKDRQLVPGDTEGSRHCLDSFDGVKFYRHPKQDAESLRGPCLVLSKERTILHPKHGAVTIPAGFTVGIRYQREYDAEQKRERRNAD